MWIQLESQGGMSLAKIPFILLATWGINMTYRPPNPTPPKHERFSESDELSVPLQSLFSGILQWGLPIGRVSNYSEDIFSRKNSH